MDESRLDSWKEIASFFRREVRTVQLWERHEALPVHRHQHRKLGTVYAYKGELRAWWKHRCASRTPEKAEAHHVENKPPATPQPRMTLEVLPFQIADGHLGGRDLEAAHSLTEKVAAGLDKFMPRQLRVVCSLAAAQRHAAGFNPEDSETSPQPDYFLRATLFSASQNPRVALELLRVSDQHSAWTATFEYPGKSASAIHTDLAENISRALFDHVLMSRHILRAKAVNPAARYAYLRGRYLWSQRTSAATMFEAMREFKLATELDPQHAPAFSGLADCYAVLGWLGALPRQTAMPEARRAALKALALDGTLAEGHVSLGCVLFDYDWDWQGAERELLHGIDLNPAYAQAYCWYAQVLASRGRSQQAVSVAHVAQDMDPASPVVSQSLGTALYHHGRYDDAIQQFRHVLTMQPDYALAHSALGLAYEQAGDIQRALEHLRRAVESSSRDPHMQAALAYAYARAGDDKRAQELLQHVRNVEAQRGMPAMDVAAAYTALGEKDMAFRYLREGFDQRNARLTKLKCDPRLIPLHADPRFQSLAAEMRLL